MDPRKLSQLLPYLKEKNLFLKKSASQNFLIDTNILRKIVEKSHISPNENILEIGSGAGAITKTLLEKGAYVTAIEKDHRFATMLQETMVHDHLSVIEGDFLTLNLKREAKIVANIPYQITAPIIEKIASSNLYHEIYLVVQKEVAERMVATPESKNTSSFTIFVQYHFIPTILFDINPGSFYPPPKVKSSFISLLKKEKRALSDPTPFFKFVREVFQKKRKMMRSILKNENIEEILRSRGLSDQSRPEELTLDDFLFLFHSIRCNKSN